MNFLTSICENCSKKNANNLMTKNNASPLDQQTTVLFFDSIMELENAYKNNDIVKTNNFFLQPDYFHFLENSLPKNIKTAFLTLEKQGKIVGFVALQLLKFNAAESVRQKEKNWKTNIQRWLAKQLDFYILAAGNGLLSGEHAIWIDNQEITESYFYEYYFQKSLDWAAQQFKKRGIKIEAFFAKDFFEPKPIKNSSDTGGGAFHEISVDPHFVLALSEDWETFDDYLNAFHAKARTRVKRAEKKIVDLELKNFNEERIIAFKTEIEGLYTQISESANFNLFKLDGDYFLKFKQHFPEDFQLFGYFKTEKEQRKLVAFFTTIRNGDELEAHFLGYDKSENQEHQLYLNVLFQIIRVGIESGARRVVFGRTASEIKSSVGAQAHHLKLYFRHRRTWINRLFPFIFKRLAPNPGFEPRNPFKTETP